MKHDLVHGTTEIHDDGSDRVTLEPVFVKRLRAVTEDDGWIMSYVYNRNRLSGVVILDAQDFGGDPIAMIRLPASGPLRVPWWPGSGY